MDTFGVSDCMYNHTDLHSTFKQHSHVLYEYTHTLMLTDRCSLTLMLATDFQNHVCLQCSSTRAHFECAEGIIISNKHMYILLQSIHCVVLYHVAFIVEDILNKSHDMNAQTV